MSTTNGDHTPPETVELDEATLESFNHLTLEEEHPPDADTDNQPSDSSSITSGSVNLSQPDAVSQSSGDIGTNLWMVDKKSSNESESNLSQNDQKHKSPKRSKSKYFKNPIKILRKYSQTNIDVPLLLSEPDLNSVVIDTLPQHFVTKYLGKKSCDGLHGVDNIRRPIDKMVRQATGNAEADDLPLVQITVWPKGLQAIIHPKSTNRKFEPFYLPIEFISFCSEHGNYRKIVGIISVMQMGAASTKTECQGYICHSPLQARKLTVSMSTAFSQYAERLNGNPVKFKVNLCDEKSNVERRKVRARKEFEA